MPTPDTSPRSRMAGGAYWAMMKRIVIVAGCINAAWIPMYGAVGAPFLTALSGVSVLAYATAYWLIVQRRNKAAAILIWAEVLLHAALGSLLIGWNSGYQYFLLMFIPALVVGSAQRRAVPLVGLLLTFYLGLYAACQTLGPLSPLQPWALQLAYGVNVLLVFGMFYAMAAFYRTTVIQAERRLLAAATTDPLTGLANRAAFHLRAQSELAQGRRRGEPMSLMLADVDFFKRINDEFGHDAGDLVLVRLAELMRQTLREVDVLARWGGEEFLALLPSADASEAAAVAERLRQAVAAVRIDIGGRMVQVTMSFGIAEVQADHDLQSAMQGADKALYGSKREGRNRVSCASASADLQSPSV